MGTLNVHFMVAGVFWLSVSCPPNLTSCCISVPKLCRSRISDAVLLVIQHIALTEVRRCKRYNTT
ncbi:hypothetical protein M758_7G153500 [Ceratodon purpureus]|uniref:Secreted protein n=1 Tax=Ceratodon purpureus TaxID=3225 RepID=A0A8T0H7S8_CERPU|nr:hypothetical protein KC19_7G124800 [Ceratodon purpureus]KAG0611627.1 hypothetical protein M758_7G153500 [Ceratodon purpureus]